MSNFILRLVWCSCDKVLERSSPPKPIHGGARDGLIRAPALPNLFQLPAFQDHRTGRIRPYGNVSERYIEQFIVNMSLTIC
jgi:hypothetical protein